MPQHRSPAKRIRSDAKRRLRNRVVKTQVKSAVRNLKESKDPEAARQLLPEVYRVLDRASKRGVIRTRTAARRKSRLAKRAAKPS